MAKFDIVWPQFAVCNDNHTKAFENMCRWLFKRVYLQDKCELHTDHNLPGIEVLPVLEPVRKDGKPQKRISFQSKYVEQVSSAYSKFKQSALKTVKIHKGKLDLVYLFCNKTLTTTSKQYKEIEEIHNKAGIETIPVSNEDILDLVKEHDDIAEYYFSPRINAGSSSVQNAQIKGVSVNAVTGEIVISPVAFQSKPANVKILQEYVAEKLDNCRKHVYELEMDALKSEVDKLLSKDIDGLEGSGEAYYFKLLSLLHEGKDTTEILVKCAIEYKNEAEWLINFFTKPVALSVDEYKRHTPITQLFIVDRLFSVNQWSHIKELYDSIKDITDSSVLPQLDFFYGLSLLNLQENQKASAVLHTLFDRTKKAWLEIYAIIADIRVENNVYQSGEEGHHERLAFLVNRLDSFRDQKQYKLQEALISELKMESLYRLGMKDREYLDQAIIEFKTYSENAKTNPVTKYYYAMCLELYGERDKAIVIYKTLDLEQEQVFAQRCMACLILNGQPQEAIAVYQELVTKNANIDGIYLLALECTNATSFEDEFKKCLKIYGNSLFDFFQVTFYINKTGTVEEICIAALRELMTDKALKELKGYQKIGLVTYLSNCRELGLLEAVLDKIDDVASINHFTVGEIYKALFEVANREQGYGKQLLLKSDNLDIADRIAEKFLKKNVACKFFLQIRVLCATAWQEPSSSLKYAKELFEFTKDTTTAFVIVRTLYNRGEKKPAEYEPYLDFLKDSEQPVHCMLVAFASHILGREDSTEFYAYKAFYLLNTDDDYEVYKGYFTLFSNRLQEARDYYLKAVKRNVVITLEDNNSEEEPVRYDICLDSEEDFSDNTNRSMGVEHLPNSALDYVKLIGCSLGQIVKIHNRDLKIVQIVPRVNYGVQFIFKKIQEKPEMFKGVIWMLPADNIDEMLRQMHKLTDNSEQIETLLKFYHFEENGTGLPVDMFTFGDYGRYIRALIYLLYQKDEAFYAGEPVNENEEGQKYVPALSTLVLLSVLERMDIFRAFKHQIIIPESYLAFIRNEYLNAVRLHQNAPSSLAFIEDKPVLLENDETISKIWERILSFCEDCNVVSISDEERINLKFDDGPTVEKLIAVLHANLIHLDALVLSRRENATFLCDDLFFRKLAVKLHIRNLNIVSLVQHYTNLDFVVPFLMELSKTNYIYIPLLSRTDEEAQELYKNIMNGVRKQRYYNDLLNRYALILKHFFNRE